MFGSEAIHSSHGVYVNSQLVYALGDGAVFYGAQSHINASQGDGADGFRHPGTRKLINIYQRIQ